VNVGGMPETATMPLRPDGPLHLHDFLSGLLANQPYIKPVIVHSPSASQQE